MKKIINGKLYDTETATEVGSVYSGYASDFRYWAEHLFRKRTGEYFLYGKGGPMSRYAVTRGQNEWSGGEKIIPLDYKAACKWAEEHMDVDDYQAEFGPVSDSDGARVVLSISIDSAIAEKIRREAQAAGMSVSALIASKF